MVNANYLTACFVRYPVLFQVMGHETGGNRLQLIRYCFNSLHRLHIYFKKQPDFDTLMFLYLVLARIVASGNIRFTSRFFAFIVCP